ncbi:protein HEAT INTOLERANT 4-like [Rutidosis leptorrhynchoides]|uniref:protein HEAT INTOLERANT 4-like n=1 Tax=Rutidosis leptorrhynchoides TaxID=125765 RepID=UPI003A9A665D
MFEQLFIAIDVMFMCYMCMVYIRIYKKVNMPKREGTKRKHETEPESIHEQREFEDLWKQIFSVGTEWEHIDSLYTHNWNFTNLEKAFEQGGLLHDKKVYLFGSTEFQQDDEKEKLTCIPIIVAVVSPIPPSDKIGIKSVQRETEEIVNMKHMKMDWVPYIPLSKRASSIERVKQFQIFILQCVQRRAGLKQMTIDRIKKFDYCLPYIYNPFEEDETDNSTIVDIVYPPVVCTFDYEFDELEKFTNGLIDEEALCEDRMDEFKEFVREKVRELKRANRDANKKRKKAKEEMDQHKVTAFENMKVYKFYPVDSPDFAIRQKAKYVNRYYGKAHMVL